MNMLAVLMLLLGAPPADAGARLEAARRNYDIAAAQSLVSEIRGCLSNAPDPAERLLFAQSLLLVAELLRVQYEEAQNEEDQTPQRGLGEAIDSAAREGIEQADTLGETSEAYRIRADCYALMIRTKYQGKKYRAKMEKAAARAIELDPKNPRAYVSVARPYLFAGPTQGGDVKKAFELLSKAVELDPTLAAARQLRAVAYEKLGDKAKADAEWEKLLTENPKCIRSRKTMEVAGKVWSEEDGL